MARAKNYPPHRLPGAGRPSKLELGVPEAPPPDLAVFVEGRVRISADDGEASEAIGKLRAVAEELGLVVHAIDVRSDDLSAVRRAWGGVRVDGDYAAAWVKDYPGVTFLTWVEKLFLGNDPLNEITFAAARAKAKVALSRLWRDGKIVKGKNAYNQLTLWPPGPKPGLRPKAIPAEVLLAVDEAVGRAVEAAHKAGKQISTLAVAREVAGITWERRDRYEGEVL